MNAPPRSDSTGPLNTVRVCREKLLALTPLAADRHVRLGDLADALYTVFQETVDGPTLEEVITLREDIVTLRPHGHEDRATALAELGPALWSSCVYIRADAARLSRAIYLLREALALAHPRHPGREFILTTLANALRTDFQTNSRMEALSEAVDLLRLVLGLRPPGHSLRYRSLHDLALALCTLFDVGGNSELHAEAVALLRESFQLGPPETRARGLTNLANALTARYVHFGNPEAIAESVSSLRQALELMPPGNPLRHFPLTNMAEALIMNFRRGGDLEVISEAIAALREDVEICLLGHRDRAQTFYLLAYALCARFQRQGNVSELLEAIDLLRESLALHPIEHPRRQFAADGLAKALLLRFQHGGEAQTLEQAVSLSREALDLRPSGHPFRHLSLAHLSQTLRVLHEQTGDPTALYEALELYQEGLDICPLGHPRRAEFSFGASACFLHPNTPRFSIAESIPHISGGIGDIAAPTAERLQGAITVLGQVEQACLIQSPDNSLLCERIADRDQLDLDILKTYIQAVRLLPLAASLGLNHAARLSAIAGSDVLCRNAAMRAIAMKRDDEAVEMLEEGRGVFWSQALHLRSSELASLQSEDRCELERIFSLLNDGSRGLESVEMSVAQRERLVEERRLLSKQAERLIDQLRRRPGLERFLMPPAFSSLLQRLPQGFVIILMASDLGYRALILGQNYKQAKSLTLTPSVLNLCSAAVRASLPRDSNACTDTNSGDVDVTRLTLVKSHAPCSSRSGSLESILAALWTSLVKPIIDDLGLQVCPVRVAAVKWACALIKLFRGLNNGFVRVSGGARPGN
jgi:tetratricopeptide (TPR) repeat protein